jgi:hypothetical protein
VSKNVIGCKINFVEKLNLIFFKALGQAPKVTCPALQKIGGASLFSAKYSETGLPLL